MLILDYLVSNALCVQLCLDVEKFGSFLTTFHTDTSFPPYQRLWKYVTEAERVSIILCWGYTHDIITYDVLISSMQHHHPTAIAS